MGLEPTKQLFKALLLNYIFLGNNALPYKSSDRLVHPQPYEKYIHCRFLQLMRSVLRTLYPFELSPHIIFFVWSEI